MFTRSIMFTRGKAAHSTTRALSTKKIGVETQLAHAGCGTAGVGRDSAHKGLTPPIYLASTFERDKDLEYSSGFIYGRTTNPTRSNFEETLAGLENGGDCAAFGSGMAAISSIFQASPGAHVLLPDDVYHGTGTVLATVFKVSLFKPQCTREVLEWRKRKLILVMFCRDGSRSKRLTTPTFPQLLLQQKGRLPVECPG